MSQTVRINAYSTRRQTPPPPGSGPIVTRGLWSDGILDRTVAEHLDAMRAYVAQEAPAPLRGQLDDHVAHVWWHHSLRADPGELAAVLAWAREANAVVYVEDRGLLDPDGRALLGDDADGEVPVLPAALERARTQRELLARRGIAVPTNVAPIRSADEVQLRPAGEVALRALGLALSSYFATGVLSRTPEQLNADDMRRDYPRAFAAMTAAEAQLFADRDPAHAAAVRWNLHDAEALLWALGRLPLRLPDSPPTGAMLIDASFGIPEAALLETAQLRPLSVLLDEAEREHTLSAVTAPHADADPRIVAHRDRALRWLLDPRLDWASLEEAAA